MRREFEALPTDDSGTALLSDVVDMLDTDGCKLLLKLAGVNPKAVKEYKEEVKQANAAMLAYQQVSE